MRRLHRAVFLAALGGSCLLPRLSAQSIAATGTVATTDAQSQIVNVTPTSQSAWDVGGPLYVGHNTAGALAVGGGATVSSTTGRVGYNITGFSGNGTVTIDGAGSAWNLSGQLNVGTFATGHLTLSAGGDLTAVTAVLGSNSGGSGTVIVTGAGSSLVLSGGNPSQLILGSSGSGALSILDGGAVSSSDVGVGQSVSGTGDAELVVSGAGSLLTATRLLVVGDGSLESLLDIGAGGAVDSASAYVGFESTGGVTLSGAGSSWTVADQLYVGFYRNATVTVSDGATLASRESILGLFNTYGAVTATLVVSGAGSSWTSDDYIGIGYEAAGELTVEKGAIVTTPSLEFGTHATGVGRLELLGDGDGDGAGTFATAAVERGDGAGSIFFDGGRLRATGDVVIGTAASFGIDVEFGAGGARIDTNGHDIAIATTTGPGGLVKEGAGTLTLSGTQGYQGATVVQAGLLRSNAFYSTSEVVVQSGAAFGGLATLAGDLTVQPGGRLTLEPEIMIQVNGTVALASGFGADDLQGLTSALAVGAYGVIATDDADFAAMGLENWGVADALDLGDGKYAYLTQSGNNLMVVVTTSTDPLVAWRQTHFFTMLNEGSAADTADPDHDGLSNFLEYATGSLPTTPSAPATVIERVGDKLRLTYQRVADPSLIYTVEAADTLGGSWDPVATPGNPSTGAANVAGPVSVTDTALLSEHPRRFLRLTVER